MWPLRYYHSVYYSGSNFISSSPRKISLLSFSLSNHSEGHSAGVRRAQIMRFRGRLFAVRRSLFTLHYPLPIKLTPTHLVTSHVAMEKMLDRAGCHDGQRGCQACIPGYVSTLPHSAVGERQSW